ncbi:hypothetical protein ECZU24_19630 [Escherichia coli]|nr:hypothetical protein ECZU24_19630 [Escherichia coli]
MQVPTADAQALGEGNQAVLVSGKDATGNTVTGAQLLTVDTQPPTLAINTIAQDNIVSAAEHNAALVLSGTSNAEAGQTVTLTVNGKAIQQPSVATEPASDAACHGGPCTGGGELRCQCQCQRSGRKHHQQQREFHGRHLSTRGQR